MINQAKEHIKSSELADVANKILYPGEDYERSRAENMKSGVFVDDSVWEEIKALSV